jgi:hypothetical protein
MTASRTVNNINIDTLWACVISGGLGSLAGVAALLRSNRSDELSRKDFWTAILNSGLFSMAIGAFIVWKLGTDETLLAIVLSILSGLGGNALVDFSLGMFKMWARKQVDGNDKKK